MNWFHRKNRKTYQKKHIFPNTSGTNPGWPGLEVEAVKLLKEENASLQERLSSLTLRGLGQDVKLRFGGRNTR